LIESNGSVSPTAVRQPPLLWTPGAHSPIEAQVRQVPYPVRNHSFSAGKTLFLDGAGTVTIVSNADGKAIRTYPAAGATDAVFLNDDYALIAVTSAERAGTSSFMQLNCESGETMPGGAVNGIVFELSGDGTRGLYASVIQNSANGANTATSVMRLTQNSGSGTGRWTASPVETVRGEELDFLVAPVGDTVVSTLSNVNQPGETAHIAQGSRPVPLERTEGLPAALLAAGNYIIMLDGEGGVNWFGTDGRLAASFVIHGSVWELREYSHGWGGKRDLTKTRQGSILSYVQ
jgi:hypothetical protein